MSHDPSLSNNRLKSQVGLFLKTGSEAGMENMVSQNYCYIQVTCCNFSEKVLRFTLIRLAQVVLPHL